MQLDCVCVFTDRGKLTVATSSKGDMIANFFSQLQQMFSPSPPQQVMGVHAEAYATVEEACFTSSGAGGWISTVLHVRPARMTGLCVVRGWAHITPLKHRFLQK